MQTVLASPQRQEPEYLFPFRSSRSAMAALSPATAVQGPSHSHAFTLTVRGLIHHRPTGALAAMHNVPSTAHLCLVRKPNNKHDENAIAVLMLVGELGEPLKLGYAAKEQAAVLAPFLDAGVAVERVALIGQGMAAVGKQEDEQGDAMEVDVPSIIKPHPDDAPRDQEGTYMALL